MRRRSAMTSKSMPREECVALAQRVSDGDREFVDCVRSDRGDKIFDRHFDNLHALARGLERQLEAAGCVDRTWSGGYKLAYPNHGRFQALTEQLESDWLPQAQELTLVEYLENLFVKERGAIRREEIEQILAPTDEAHRANGSDATKAEKAQNGYRVQIWEVAEEKFPKEIPWSMNDTQLKEALLSALLKKPGVTPKANPVPRTFGRALKHYPRSKRA
jgi:hypothetical protein